MAVNETVQVRQITYDPMMNLSHEFINLDKPLVLRGADLGKCLKWSVDYLCDKLSDKVVPVHSSLVSSLSFLEKNFIYKEMSFPDFMKKVSVQYGADKVPENYEHLYLRSIGDGKRTSQVANIENDFPTIAKDINFSDFIPMELFFSSVLRISAKRTQIWTHYDVLDNALFQISGIKKVVLFSPSDADYLYLQGDKSKVLDVDRQDQIEFPLFKLATRYECVLLPGDVLYIPALWFHNTICYSFSIGANVFWKSLPPKMYNPRDVYGNKDPLPAAECLNFVNKGIDKLKLLPRYYQDFYCRRAIQLLEKLKLSPNDEVNVNSDLYMQGRSTDR